MYTSLSKLLGGLVLSAAMLVLAIFAVLGVVAVSASAGPLAQGHGPGTGPFGTTNQNNCSAYMAAYGYKVDAVGHPLRSDGQRDAASVVMLMPMQSTRLQQAGSMVSDAEVQKQLSLALIACALYYPGVPSIGIGLEQNQSIHMFSAQAADILAVQRGTMSTEEFWARVGPTETVLDARTGRQAAAMDFVRKDFTGRQRLSTILPANVEPPSKGTLQIRLQTSTAYVPTGGNVDLVATVLDGAGNPAVGRPVSFSYTSPGSDPQAIGSQSTGADGAARIRFTPGADLLGAVLAGASITDSTGTHNAASVVTIGSPTAATPAPANVVSGTTPLSVITQSLRLQGYTIIDDGTARRFLPSTQATMLSEIVAPRFDMSVRAQILTIGGTLLSAFPDATSSEPALLYRSQGAFYVMIFHLERSDWASWFSGAIDEATLWQRVALSEVVDGSTGQPVSSRNFAYKTFTGARVAAFTSPHQVASTLTRESWGDQLRTGRFQVPIDSTADTFTIQDRTPGAEFAVYTAMDPTRPLYNSSGDTDGSRLRSLTLSTGQYLLSLTVGNTPSAVTLSYVERLGGLATGTR